MTLVWWCVVCGGEGIDKMQVVGSGGGGGGSSSNKYRDISGCYASLIECFFLEAPLTRPQDTHTHTHTHNA